MKPSRRDGGDGTDGDGSAGADDGDAEGYDEVSAVEKAAMIASIAITVALFAFVSWHAVTGTETGAPEASITSTDETAMGTVHEVEIRNPGDVGLASVTAVVRCGDPVREVGVTNVPADGTKQVTVVCPTGAGVPVVEVVQWIRQ